MPFVPVVWVAGALFVSTPFPTRALSAAALGLGYGEENRWSLTCVQWYTDLNRLRVLCAQHLRPHQRKNVSAHRLLSGACPHSDPFQLILRAAHVKLCFYTSANKVSLPIPFPVMPFPAHFLTPIQFYHITMRPYN